MSAGPENSLEGSGWPEFFDDGVLLTLRGKTGRREVEIGRGPVAALKAWLKFARIARGPPFRAVVRREVGSEPLNDRHVARLVKRLALAAGVRGDLSERERVEKFRATRCAPGSPRRPRSTNATSRSTSATPRRK